MKSCKRALKLFGLMLLIVLASFGVGLGGGVPVRSFTRKEDATEIKVELVESKTEKEKPDAAAELNTF